jgi:hypothetical protein
MVGDHEKKSTLMNMICDHGEKSTLMCMIGDHERKSPLRNIVGSHGRNQQYEWRSSEEINFDKSDWRSWEERSREEVNFDDMIGDREKKSTLLRMICDHGKKSALT